MQDGTTQLIGGGNTHDVGTQCDLGDFKMTTEAETQYDEGDTLPSPGERKISDLLADPLWNILTTCHVSSAAMGTTALGNDDPLGEETETELALHPDSHNQSFKPCSTTFMSATTDDSMRMTIHLLLTTNILFFRVSLYTVQTMSGMWTTGH